MKTEWKNEQLERVHNGTAIFKYIPNEIGNILYCDSSIPKEEPLTESQAKKKKITSILISICGLALIWGFLYSHYIWASILSIILLLACHIIFDTSFNGKDYFAGENGYAIVEFKGNRNNITNKKIILFKDLSYLFSGEVIQRKNNYYYNTEFFFYFYYKPENDIFQKADSVTGNYCDKTPKDPMNPSGSSQEYQLMKVVEKQWTLFFLNSHKEDDEVNFAIWPDKEDTIYANVIKIGHDYIEIEGTKYNKSNTKKIYYKNGSLVIEHINYKTKWFGFKHEGNKNSIPLLNVGNSQAFLMLFENFYKT